MLLYLVCYLILDFKEYRSLRNIFLFCFGSTNNPDFAICFEQSDVLVFLCFGCLLRRIPFYYVRIRFKIQILFVVDPWFFTVIYI